jgi:hypothetical protein
MPIPEIEIETENHPLEEQTVGLEYEGIVKNRIITKNCQHGFPANKKLLDFIQDELLTDYIQQIARGVFGEYATGIIAGCEGQGNTVSAGIVMINGIVYPFKGGGKYPYITIKNTLDSAIFHDGIEHDAFSKSVAAFTSVQTNLTWNALNNRFLNSSEIKVKLNDILDGLNKYVKKTEPIGSTYFIGMNTTYTVSAAEYQIVWHDDTVYASLRGAILLKRLTVTTPAWYQIGNLTTGNGIYLIPRTPWSNAPVYFEGIRVSESDYSKILFRFTKDGKFEVFAVDDNVFNPVGDSRIYVNVVFANPPVK